VHSPSLVLVRWFFLRLLPFPACRPALQPNRDPRLAHDSLLHPQRRHFPPWLPAGCSAMAGRNRLAEPASAAPRNAWLDRLRHWLRQALETASFGGCRRLVLLGLLGGWWLGGAGPWPAANRLQSPRRTTARCAASWCSRWCLTAAGTERVVEKVRQVVAEEKLVRVGNFYAGRSFGDKRPKQRLSSSCATTARSRGNAKNTTKLAQRLGAGHREKQIRGPRCC